MNYFLASVGEAELLTKRNGKLQLFASAKALTNSVINFSGTMEEVRGGNGAKLMGRFNAKSSVSIQLTNVIFSLKEIAAQIGANIKNGANIKKFDQDAYIADNKIYTNDQIYPLSQHCGLDDLICWVTSCGCDGEATTNAYNVKRISGGIANNIVGNDNYCAENNICGSNGKFVYKIISGVPISSSEKKYKISYYVPDKNAITAEINAALNPVEFVLILKAKLFAGDSKSVESGKNEVGTITIKIPRFQLDGALDLSLSMAQVASVGMSGIALVDSDTVCSNGGEYAEIVEFIKTENNIKSIIFENEDEGISFFSLEIDDYIPEIFGIKRNNEIVKIDVQDITITSNIEDLVIDKNGKIIRKPYFYDGDGYIKAVLNENNRIFTKIEII